MPSHVLQGCLLCTRVYLRALTTVSCPDPLWRQKSPKQMLEMRDIHKINQGPEGLGKKQTGKQTMERGKRKGRGKESDLATPEEESWPTEPTGRPGGWKQLWLC